MRRSTTNRVYVSGVGAVSPLGLDWDSTWKSLVAGKSGIGGITSFDPQAFRSQIAGEVKGFSPEGLIDPKSAERVSRFVLFALSAVHQALGQSGLMDKTLNLERVAVLIGSGIGGLWEAEVQQARLLEKGPRSLNPLGILKLIVNGASGQISVKYGFQGPSFSPTSACASGAHALATALDMLRSGRADVAIAGGAEASITPLCLGAFCAMQALSLRNDSPNTASRPFDQTRDGFVLGEGCGIAVLETEEHLKKRGGVALAEFCGAGFSSDAHHQTCPHPTGRGYAQAMQWALQDSLLEAAEIDYINAHATSTKLCDEIELEAIKTVFNANRKKPFVSSTKSMTGHLLGAAGGVEFATIIESLRCQVCPPTINLSSPINNCEGFDLVPNRAKEVQMNYVMSNSFGFGGHNVSLICGRP